MEIGEPARHNQWIRVPALGMNAQPVHGDNIIIVRMLGVNTACLAARVAAVNRDAVLLVFVTDGGSSA